MAMQPGEEVARGSLAAGRSRYERDSMGRRWISTGLDSHSNRKRCISISSCCHSSEHSLTWFQHRAKGEMVSGRGDHGRRTQLNVSLNMFVTRSQMSLFSMGLIHPEAHQLPGSRQGQGLWARAPCHSVPWMLALHCEAHFIKRCAWFSPTNRECELG
jgi:hypothetical protein